MSPSSSRRSPRQRQPNSSVRRSSRHGRGYTLSSQPEEPDSSPSNQRKRSSSSPPADEQSPKDSLFFTTPLPLPLPPLSPKRQLSRTLSNLTLEEDCITFEEFLQRRRDELSDLIPDRNRGGGMGVRVQQLGNIFNIERRVYSTL